jgi:hypothetical protein
MHYSNTHIAMMDVIMDVNAGVINPDPIGQRPPVSSGWSKAQGIIDSIINGFSIGTITVRNIENDAPNQLVYPGVKWLVIDGGNRIRAIRDFQRGEFNTLDGRNYRQLTAKEKENFDMRLNFCEYFCNDREATEIFRRLNTVTPVNKIEMIMANDVSNVARVIRCMVKSYKEYQYNDTHPIFSTVNRNNGKIDAKFWNTDVNPRRRWDEYVGIVILKTLGGGNVTAGLDALDAAVEDDIEISEKALKTVNRFFDDALDITRVMGSGKKMNGDSFAAFQAVWFALYEQNKSFVIKDHYIFATEFYGAHAVLCGIQKHDYDKEVREFKSGPRNTLRTKTDTVRGFARTAIKNFANPAEQAEVAKLYLDHMKIENCVLFRDDRRTVSKDGKFERLALQDFKCAIDGLPLSIDDAIFGHDTAWAQGGQIEEGAIIRKIHNINMGTTTIEEYRVILEMRKNKVVQNAEAVV